jgi:hypothetical protein
MNIGEKVSLKGVTRGFSRSGTAVSYDPPIDVEGVVVNVADFIDKRICVEFTNGHEKQTKWLYVFELPEYGIQS